MPNRKGDTVSQLPVLLFVLCIAVSTVGESKADEYFGEFTSDLRGEFLRADPRPLFRLLADFSFSDPNGFLWEVPAESSVDGASIPPAFWSLIGGPFSGKYVEASVVHDYYCETMGRTEHDTHRNFYYGMRASGVGEWKARFMYWAVAAFGPKWRLEKRTASKTVCSGWWLWRTCRQVEEIEEFPVAEPGIDLDDRQVLAVALSKASAVMRTLKTSNGQILDVAASGPIGASLDEIEANAESYGNLISGGRYLQDPAALGVLAKWRGAGGFEEVKNWEGNTLPTIEGTAVLRPGVLRQIESGAQFRLDDMGTLDILKEEADFRDLKYRLEER